MTSPSLLPIVTQLGFSGARFLFESEKFSNLDPVSFHDQIQEHLTARLARLPEELSLTPQHFLCGISQIAIGADSLFTKACASLSIAQRIFLTQGRNEYLDAKSPKGTPDFSEAEKQSALDLLASPHIIQEQVVSDSHDRTDRFEDTNLEILRASDVFVCLIRANSEGKAGGSKAFLRDAKQYQRPVLEIEVSVDNGQAVFKETWHGLEGWAPSSLPEEIRESTITLDASAPPTGVPAHVSNYLETIKSFGSDLALWKQKWFKNFALAVIGAHLLATLGAILAMIIDHHSSWIPIFLIAELLLLAAGYGVHHHIHHAHVVRSWATNRLMAEIARSVGSLRELHVQLSYLFHLPFPEAFRPLLRTINVLHLAATKHSTLSWEQKCEHYVGKRLDGPHGQIDYYSRSLPDANKKMSLASNAFFLAALGAFVATSAKLTLLIGEHHLDWHPPHILPQILGSLAILLPVIAVGALSLAASFDLEARSQTYQETLDYLQRTHPLFSTVHSERSLTHLVLQTEARLLGETANWYSRRSFTSVT